jgi:sarcosine oxidase subunit gamma
MELDSMARDVTVERRPHRHIFNVSGFPGATEVEAILARSCGVPVPQPGHACLGEGLAVLGLGLQSWLVTATNPVGVVQLRKVSVDAGAIAAVVDQSDAFVCFSISGPASSDLLASGSSVDFRADRFPPLRCAATNLGKVAVLIHSLPTANSFELYVPRSFADDTQAWLLRVAKELEATKISAIDGEHEFASLRHDAKRRATG